MRTKARLSLARAVSTTTVNAIELATNGIEMKCKNPTVSSRQTDLEAELVKIRVARRTMRSQITAAESWINTLKAQLTDARMALDKLTSES